MPGDHRLPRAPVPKHVTHEHHTVRRPDLLLAPRRLPCPGGGGAERGSGARADLRVDTQGEGGEGVEDEGVFPHEVDGGQGVEGDGAGVAGVAFHDGAEEEVRALVEGDVVRV